jgi:hypothetical protein
MWRQVVAVGRKLHLWPRSPSNNTITVWRSGVDGPLTFGDAPFGSYQDRGGVVEARCRVETPTYSYFDSTYLDRLSWLPEARDALVATPSSDEASAWESWCYVI